VVVAAGVKHDVGGGEKATEYDGTKDRANADAAAAALLRFRLMTMAYCSLLSMNMPHPHPSLLLVEGHDPHHLSKRTYFRLL